jgi:thioredoxin 1
MQTLVISMLLGGGIGAAIGYFGKCTSGGCPLTANWHRGALYGAFLGLVVYFISGRETATPASSKTTPNIQRIEQNQFEAEVVKSALPVVVEFYADWCAPCQILGPALDQLAGPMTNRVKFVKINLDEAQELAQHVGITGVPTLLFVRDGKLVAVLPGLPPLDVLKQHVEAFANAK